MTTQKPTSEEIATMCEEAINRENLEPLESLVAEHRESLSDDDIANIVNAYDSFCEIWLEDSREPTLEYIIELQDAIEILDPNISCAPRRAACHELLSTPYETTDPDRAIAHLDTAIAEYQKQEHCAYRIAKCRLDQCRISQMLSEENFEEVLALHRQDLYEYNPMAFLAFLSFPFSLVGLPNNLGKPYFARAESAFDDLAYPFAKAENSRYFTWSKALRQNIEYTALHFTPKELIRLYTKSNELLQKIEYFETERASHTSEIGNEFAKQAEIMNTSNQKFEFYHMAIRWFDQGRKREPAAWTFPVYQTNALKAIAHMHRELGKTALMQEAYETGDAIFQEGDVHMLCDFTFQLYYGEFLLDFARYAYDFKNTELLERAVRIFTLAIELGKGYYTGPYIGLAKALLKLGDREGCLKALSHEIMSYQIDSVAKDPDFEEVWDVLPEFEKVG